MTDKPLFQAQTADFNICPEFAHRSPILLVEDEEILRLATAKMLRKRGFIVLTAADGGEAVNLLRMYKEAISLLLLDVTLPGLSSREVLEEARRARPGIRVVLTSANSEVMVDLAFAGAPIDHFIRKPYRLAELVCLLEGIFSAS